MLNASADVRILRRSEIESLVAIDSAALEAIHQSFVWIDSARVVMPPIMHIDVPEFFGALDIKSAYVRGLTTLAVKIGAGYANNKARGLPSSPAMVVLLNAATGMTSAILLDEGYLTDLRTGLAGALATRLMAPDDSLRVGLIGAGIQARFQIRSLRLVRGIDAISIWSRNRDSAVRLQAELSLEFDCPISVGPLDDVVAKSNCLITTTPSTDAVVRLNTVQPGTHITSVGSDLPGKRELDPALIRGADWVACDDIAQSRRLGELQNIDPTTLRNEVHSLPTLAAARIRLSRSPRDITIADLTGLGVQDTAIANELMQRLAFRHSDEKR